MNTLNISGYTKRSISTQTGNFGYNLGLAFGGTTGICGIYFSGATGAPLLGLNFISGKIYDNNNRYVYSYNTGQTLNLQGFISPTNHNLYANGVPIEFTGNRTTGYVNWMVVAPTGYSVGLTFSYTGTLPNFSIPYINFITTGQTGTGYFSNNNPSVYFRLFAGSGTGSINYSFPSLPTGNITGSGSFLVQRNYSLLNSSQLSSNTGSQIFDFETNFGHLTSNIPIVYGFPLTQTISELGSNLYSGTNMFYIYWQNLLGSIPYFSTINNQITFYPVSGSETGAFQNKFNVQTGYLSNTGYVPLAYNPLVSGYQSPVFQTIGISGLTILVTQNTGFTGVNVFNLYFSGYNTGLNTLITGSNTPVTENLTYTGFNPSLASGVTSSTVLYWNNTFGNFVYPYGLNSQLSVSWISGTSSGDFNHDFTVKTGYTGGGGMITLPYISAITGYQSPVFQTFLLSGLTIQIIQNSGFAGLSPSGNLLSFFFTGYNTGIKVTISGSS